MKVKTKRIVGIRICYTETVGTTTSYSLGLPFRRRLIVHKHATSAQPHATYSYLER